MNDIKAIFWKEWKEILLQPGGRGKYTVFIFIALIGIVFPMQQGEHWLSNLGDLTMPLTLPMFLTLSIIADSVAGEKERHTLETLLASRLSDTSVLLGKIAVCISYYLMVVLVSLALAFTIYYFRYMHFPTLPFSLLTIVGILLLCFLMALLIACIGVLISLKASTAKQAQQTLSLGILALIMLPLLGFKMLPADKKASFLNAISGFDMHQLFTITASILVALNVLLVLFTIGRFKRSKLIM